jgi:hypothetical protein
MGSTSAQTKCKERQELENQGERGQEARQTANYLGGPTKYLFDSYASCIDTATAEKRIIFLD